MTTQRKILLVDDEPANLLALRAVLEDMGHALVDAHSGREALRHLMSDDFSIILMDVQMPTMDGFETATLIRGRERSRSTPIIFLTAVGRSENEMFRGYQVGAVDYLVKPFIPEILRFKVAVLMDLQAKSEELLAANQELKTLNASLEERVGERTLELARSNEELSQFASIASHDLQEPLRSMTTYLYLMQNLLGPGIPEEARAHMDSAVEAARRMRQLICGLLEFSRLENPGHQAKIVDCGRLLEEVLEVLDGTIAEKSARVTKGSLPTVEGDPAMLRQLFQNLLDNALKFSNGSAPVIELGCAPKESEVLVWIKDNGIGVPKKDFDKIFKLFKRLHSREEYPGSGLGLALCKKIVERHGGRLWLESELGKGSTFYFTLPLETGHVDANRRELSAIRGGGGGGFRE